MRNNTGHSKRFSLAANQKQVLLFYGCENMQDQSIGCSAENTTRSVVAIYGDDVENLKLARKNCNVTTVSVTMVEDEKGGIEEGLRRGFLMNWTAKNCSECSMSGGRCGFDEEEYAFICYCPDRIDLESCYPQPGSIAAAVMAGLLSICYFAYKSPRWREKYCFPTKSNQDIETFLKNHGVLTIKRYKFSDVKKMTKSFKVKLGQGGFGAVYKGVLPNGSHVAVKMLNPSKGNGKEFINEVASISRTSHVNVVTLLGFCFQGGKKVLIYEFISNGSLDKFIYRKEGFETTSLLSWDKLYQISIGIARGLDYGMMLLDIVGGKKNINVECSQTSEVYFPDWIYKRVEQEGTQLGAEDGEVATEENEVIKKMTVVGLWCIQIIPNDRPTMSKVVEMLEGNTYSIEMPPRPALSSPVRSIAESSTFCAFSKISS
ncbi:hypothetical protein PIB30_091827 [Stylosanthes scabra]|uniref:Protein kinase domain-containing protein n=1 Tax=Stylosanthes scabra TaxID=79078 RepID=A0ABU6XTR8_9FABA|nr:hypothetical protein [Stylosanthes scabra]